MMQLSDFHFDLPPERIARYPLGRRTASRLLCLNRKTSQRKHAHFDDISTLVTPGDLLVFNDTKVIPARLFGRKSTGGRVEILVERLLDEQRMLAQVYVSKPPRIGDRLFLPQDSYLEVLQRHLLFYELRCSEEESSLLELIERIGHVPLPPYLHRLPEESDKTRYQTVYAQHKGSVAAPTAGFHFDERLLQTLRDHGVEMAYLTLHIGAGTFAPVRTEAIHEHTMHAEYAHVSAELCEKVKATRTRGKRVIAVGTTSLRALEAASASGTIAPYRGDTSIFIYPGYTFHSVDALITNLHLPCSTLLMLVCAFGGHTAVMKAYQEAVLQSYRFYSYGDAMWVG